MHLASRELAEATGGSVALGGNKLYVIYSVGEI